MRTDTREEAAARVAAYIERRKRSCGIYIECIHGFDVTPDGGIELKLSDLELLVARSTQPAGWLPIETAPENTGREVVVQWMDSDGAICRDLDYREDGCWMGWNDHAEHVEIIGGHGVSYTPPYTEWMPLPPPVTKEPTNA